MSIAAAPLVSARLCPGCLAWYCAASDAFCGGCGQPCAQLMLEAFPAVLPLEQRPPKMGLRLTNPTCAGLRVEGRSAPGWLKLPTADDIEIGPQQSKSFLVEANTFSLREAQSSEISFRTTIGDVSVLIMALPESPALQTSLPVIEYWPDGQSHSREYELECFPPAGHIRVRQLLTGSGWLAVKTKLTQPVLVSREKPLRVKMEFDPRRLPLGRTENRIAAQIRLAYDSAHGESWTSLEVRFELRKPPQLTWTEQDAPPRSLRQTKGETLTFNFSNSTDADAMGGRQNGRLEIRSAVLTVPQDPNKVSMHPFSNLPLSLVGGASGKIEFQANLQSLEAKIHYFQLEIKTNFSELDCTYRVPLQVRPMEVFDGIVAIDFGTSNTCCALLSDEGDVESVPLDEHRMIAPTLVRYLDLSGPEPLMETGSLLKHLAAVDEKVASSTVQRLKQQLGEASYPLTVRPRNSNDWVTREARDAAADYLRHLRAVGEKRKGTLFESFILTHPAVCSLRQYRNLRAALQHAFGEKAKVYFLQEPIASLVPFFAKTSQNGAQASYSVAAFDLGGGTTDITVVRVTQDTGPNGVLNIRPAILASWGERFGGEDLTDFLVEEVKARCRQILASEHPGDELADRGARGASTSSIRRNGSALTEWAENFKASLSEEKNVDKPGDGILLSVVPSDLNQLPYEKQFLVREICGMGDDLEHVFFRHLSSRIGAIADRLQESVTDLARLDFIHLSGKTAFLAEVRSILQAQFPLAKIERAPDPKECVVRGACLWRSLMRGQNRRLVLPSSRRTTSQIGLLDEDGMFHPLIHLDQPIPDEGLTFSTPSLWNGQDNIVLWENLGVDNHRNLADGSRNTLISKLDTWEPSETIAGAEDVWLPLRLTLQSDFSLRVFGVAANKLVEFRPRKSER